MEQPQQSTNDPSSLLSIPIELRLFPQWVVWRYGALRSSGKREKKPYSPRTGREARANDSTTWGSFEEAVDALRDGDWDGIGFYFSETDPFVFIDLDDCRNPKTAALSPSAEQTIADMATYTEISPSGTGIHLILQGKLGKRTRHRTADIEVYDCSQFATITGAHLPNTPTRIESRQKELTAWYNANFADFPLPLLSSIPQRTGLADEEILKLARAARGKNGKRFHALFDEGDTAGYGSRSEVDMALAGLLVFYTSDTEQIERLMRQSALLRPKWNRAGNDYLERTIAAALAQRTATYRRKVRREESISYLYPWQQRIETPTGRDAYLRQLAGKVKDQVEQHIQSQEQSTLVIALPPGIGKTRTTAELGKDYNIAWFAERHDMADSVMLGHEYRHIQPCTAETCPDYRIHKAMADMGYNTWPLHKRHDCEYYRQHLEEGSAFYQIPHVQTSYPGRHDAAIVDELNLSNWLVDHAVSLEQITQARGALNRFEEEAQALLQAIYETVLEAQQLECTLYGKALLDTLDRHCGGKLTEYVEVVAGRLSLIDCHPVLPTEYYEDTAVLQAALKHRGPVILPRLVSALQQEVSKWQQGGEWNSPLRVSHGEVHIVKPRRFNLSEEKVLPLTVLDATANERLFSRLFGGPVRVERVRDDELLPPPHMRHLAVRTGNPYSKKRLTRIMGKEQALNRVAKELLYLLRKVDPDGVELAARRVGLITFKECEEVLGDRLGIPAHRRGHFWAMRGSNALEDCTILLVVGTPTPNLHSIEWMARVLYADDPDAIDTTQEQHDGGRKRYRDPRLQELTHYLVNAELTQVAHRNRPLRTDGRIVISLCDGDIDYLPITTEYTALPNLSDEGSLIPEHRQAENSAKLEQAARELTSSSRKVTVTALAELAHVRKSTASAWRREVWRRGDK